MTDINITVDPTLPELVEVKNKKPASSKKRKAESDPEDQPAAKKPKKKKTDGNSSGSGGGGAKKDTKKGGSGGGGAATTRNTKSASKQTSDAKKKKTRKTVTTNPSGHSTAPPDKQLASYQQWHCGKVTWKPVVNACVNIFPPTKPGSAINEVGTQYMVTALHLKGEGVPADLVMGCTITSLGEDGSEVELELLRSSEWIVAKEKGKKKEQRSKIYIVGTPAYPEYNLHTKLNAQIVADA